VCNTKTGKTIVQAGHRGWKRDVAGCILGSMKKPWKIVACIPAVDEAPGYHEYFIVRATDRHTALATLRKARKDLLDIACEVKGEAGHDFLDWLEFDKDVFSIIVG
jgi:hypothetical protein